MIKPDRCLLGKQSRINGKYLEDLITAGNEFYENLNIATVEKTPEPMRVIANYNKEKGQFISCFEKQAQPDFKGVLYTGQAVIFEAKHTDGDRINQSVVTQVQQENFFKYEKMNAICFVIISIRFEHFYRVPWKVFSGMKEIYGHKHMTVEELTPYEIPLKNGQLLFLERLEIEEKI